MEMTPEWVKVLPVQLRGGPQSEARLRAETAPSKEADMEGRIMAPLSMEREMGKCPHAKTCPNAKECGGKVYEGGGTVHSAKWDRCVKKVRSKGTAYSPEAICTKSVEGGKTRRKGKEAGGAVGGYEKKAGGYTGHEPDGTIIADKEVNEKTFVDHQGEFYVNAPLTQILGGPDAVEKMLIERARGVIDGKRTPNVSLPAISDMKSAGMAKSPGNANKQSYQAGGRIIPILGSVKGRGEVEVVQPPATPAPAGTAPIPAPTPAAPAPVQTMSWTPPPVPMPTPRAPVAIAPGLDEYQQHILSKQVQASKLQPAPAPAPEPAPAPVATTPSFEVSPADAITMKSESTIIPKLGRDLTTAEADLFKQKFNRPLTAEETAFFGQATKSQVAEYLGQQGVLSAEEVKKIKDQDVLAGTAAATPPKTAYDQQVRLALKRLEDLASGNDPVMKQIIDSTMQQYGSDAAAGTEALRMQLANQGISGPAAQAILDSYGRNARIGAGQLTSNFALQVAKDAQAAGQQLLQTGLEQQAVERGYTTAEQARLQNIKDTERQYTDVQRGNAMTAALSAGDFGTYGRLYEQQYGVKLDMSKPLDAATATKIKNATADIMAALGTNPAADFDDPAFGGILNKAVQSIWEAQGKTGPVPPDQAKKILEEFRTNTSPAGMLRNALSEEDVVDMFFAGDKSALEDFQVGDYKPGYESFQHALPSMFTIGGITKNANGELDFNWDKILAAFPELEIHKAVKTADPAGTTYAAGGTFTTNKGVKYTVDSVNEDGSMDLDLNGVKYKATKGAAAGDWNIAAAKVQAGFVKTVGKPVTLDGVEVTYNGQKIYAREGGTFNTKPNGTGLNVTLDDTATDPTDAVTLKGWNVNTAGNVMSSGGIEITDSRGGFLKMEGTSGKFARGAADGKLYQLGEDGLQKGAFSDMPIADFMRTMSSYPPEYVDEYIKENANKGKFTTYMDDIVGTGTPDKALVEKWIGAGDSDAVEWAVNKTIAGDTSWITNKNILAAITAKSSTANVSAATNPAYGNYKWNTNQYDILAGVNDGAEMMVSGAAIDMVSRQIGDIIMMNGKPYRMKAKPDHTLSGGIRYWQWTATDLATGKDHTVASAQKNQ